MTNNFLLDNRSLTFAEDFVTPIEGVQAAYDEAIALGIDAPSTGVCGALTFLARVVNASNVVELGTGTGATGLA